jgi:hypothetical protein
MWTDPQTPNVADYTTFLYQIVGILPVSLPATALVIPVTLALAQEIVTEWLMVASCPPLLTPPQPSLYVLAVYNLATDRLFNYAQDVNGQTFFEDARVKWRLLETSVGVPSQSSDSGTAVGILNPEQMKLLTLQDLQTLKTPFGRQYMAIAQKFGREIWGLT